MARTTSPRSRLASTSSATWRSATSRSASRFSTRKKPFSAAGTRAAGYTFPALQPLDQRGRREVDEHDLVGLREHRVRERLAHAHAGQLRHLVVERLEVLDVDGRVDVDAGVQHVGDVLVALARARARARWCGRARRSAPARAGARGSPGRSISSNGTSLYVTCRRGDAAAGPRPAPRSRPGRAARGSRSRRHDPPRAPRAPPGACGTSCRRRRPSRGRPCDRPVTPQAHCGRSGRSA